MKRNLALTTLVISLGATATFLTGCNKATQRESVVDSTISANVFQMKDISEITGSSNTVYSSSGDVDLKAMSVEGKALDQQKVEGKVQDLLAKVKIHKKDIDAQLKDGAIAIVVLNDQIKIMKVTPDTTGADALSLRYMKALKSLSVSTNPQEQAKLQSDIQNFKSECPAAAHENFGVAELASLNITSFGVLDNKKTAYGERMSILTVVPTQFQFATHIVVGDEVGAPAASDTAPVQ
jgi:glycerol kinase